MKHVLFNASALALAICAVGSIGWGAAKLIGYLEKPKGYELYIQYSDGGVYTKRFELLAYCMSDMPHNVVRDTIVFAGCKTLYSR